MPHDVDDGVLYVDGGQILISAGSAAIDLCLHLVRRDHGSVVANALARPMVIAPHRDGGQAQIIEQPVPKQAEERWIWMTLAGYHVPLHAPAGEGWGLSGDEAAIVMGIGADCGVAQVSNRLRTAKCSIAARGCLTRTRQTDYWEDARGA